MCVLPSSENRIYKICSVKLTAKLKDLQNHNTWCRCIIVMWCHYLVLATAML